MFKVLAGAMILATLTFVGLGAIRSAAKANGLAVVQLQQKQADRINQMFEQFNN